MPLGSFETENLRNSFGQVPKQEGDYEEIQGQQLYNQFGGQVENQLSTNYPDLNQVEV